MSVIFINSVNMLPPKEIIVRHFCPKYSVAQIEQLLASIRARISPKPLPLMRVEEFVCKNERCKHNKLYVPPTEYPTHKSCMKCGMVYPVIHQGKAYRDIKERGDRNTAGLLNNELMSAEYNSSDIGNKLHRLTSRDTHILEAKIEFDSISAKLHFNDTPSKALSIYCSFLDSIARVKNGKVYYKVDKPDIIYAACMFHCLN